MATLEVAKFGPVISVWEVVRFNMADSTSQQTGFNRLIAMETSKVSTRSASGVKLGLELKNVEKDDVAHFLSAYYPSLIVKGTYRSGGGGVRKELVEPSLAFLLRCNILKIFYL